MMKNYFPTVLATGNAFCNRTQELKHLTHNIEIGAPTLLISPRRYGKTSLALHALEKTHYPFAHVDLYKALDEGEIAEYILNGIGHLLGQIEKTPTKLMKLASTFFSSLQLKCNFSLHGISVELAQKKAKPVELILNALEQLDKLILKKQKKVAILFLDEFQTLTEVAKDKAIEAAIREAMQKAKAVRYVFAGSNRHLIERMFNDDSRPFFNSCDHLLLTRISSKHYSKQINKAAKERWKNTLSNDVLTAIFDATQLHPYYLNKLCAILMRQETTPTANDATEQWHKYRDENKSRVQQEISLLSINQRRLLINLATDVQVENPYSNEYSQRCGIPPTSIHRAMDFLLQRDYVYLSADKKYQVLDPLISAVLSPAN